MATTKIENKTLLIPGDRTCKVTWENGVKPMTAIIGAMGFLVDETKNLFDEDGLHAVAVDSSRVAMLSIDIGKAAFTEYMVAEPTVVQYAPSDLLKILKRLKSTDLLQLAIKSRHEIQIVGKSDKTRRAFKLKSKEDASLGAGSDDLFKKFHDFEVSLAGKFTREITLDSAVFAEILGDCEIIDILVKFQLSERGLEATATDDASEALVEIAPEQMADPGKNTEGAGLYSLDFLKGFFNNISPVAKGGVSMSLGDSIPMLLKIRFSMLENPDAAVTVKFLLAPRVEDEEEEYKDDFEIGDEEALEDAINDDEGEIDGFD